MSGFGLNVALSAASQQRIRMMEQFPGMLEMALLPAMEKGIEELEQAAIDVMYNSFQNPSGQVEGSWEQEVVSPYLAILGNTAPYAQRLEYGFSGMTDSLGRHFPYWPDYHWAEQTVIVEQDPIERIFAREISLRFDMLGGLP